MKLLNILFGLILLALIGGFGYLASVDIPVKQQVVQQEIPSDQLFNRK